MIGHGEIVVGVDGSEESRAALELALAEARARSCGVRVITAYDQPRYWALPGGMPTTVTEQEITDRVAAQTRSLVDDLLAGDAPAPPVEISAVAGGAARTLIDASRGADLLIVGHRGRGGLASAIGSVALRCALEAACTVTVVRPAGSHTR